MRFLHRAAGSPERLGILSGAFHPPTRAHLALAQVAVDTHEAEEVLFVLPREFPHKHYEAVTMEQRLEMLRAATVHEPRFSIGIASGGLFLEIARECRLAYGEGVRLRFLCGRDTAERIVNWNYESQPPIAEQLREYQLLVAPRLGHYIPPGELAPSIGHLTMEPNHDDLSSTQVRERIARGEDWEHLVPDAVREMVRTRYAPSLR